MQKCDFNKVAMQSNFIEIVLWHGCSSVNLLHIFRTPFLKNLSGRLLLDRFFLNRIYVYFHLFALFLQLHALWSLSSLAWIGKEDKAERKT